MQNTNTIKSSISAREVIQKLMESLCLVPNKDFEEGKDNHISAYGEYEANGKTILVRVSDHNTFLYNWVKNNGDVNLSQSANYAITFVDKVSFNNNPNTDNVVNDPNPPIFVLRQYVYYCNLLSVEEADLIIAACIQLACSGVFTDPLEVDDKKHSLILRHETNQPTKDITSKIRKRHRQKAKGLNNNMKESVKPNIIKINENDIRMMVSECVRSILESANRKRVGEYTAIDGSWWDGFPCGLEEMGAVQDVRMYDRLHSDGQIDTIALFRRCDNKKYFYAKIIPIEGSKETKWKLMPLREVPKIIKKDIQTVNPLGHEPYLPY